MTDLLCLTASGGSGCRGLNDCDPRIALESEGEAVGIFRVVQHGNHFFAELPWRHRRAEARQELFELDAPGARIGVGARVADAGAADNLQRHDGLEPDSEL